MLIVVCLLRTSYLRGFSRLCQGESVDTRLKIPYCRGMLILYNSTENPQKTAALKEEFDVVMPADKIISSSTQSGVAEQPRDDQVIVGARNRAMHMNDSIPTDQHIYLGAGLESGLMSPHRDAIYTQTCCAICLLDPELETPQKWIYGFSSGFTIPERIMQHVKLGLDLSQATRMAGYTMSKKIGNGEGLIGILSGGRVTRRDQLREAVRNALFNLDALL